MIATALAVHVLAVVWWVGGIAMVTTTLLPVLRRSGLSEPLRETMFKKIQRRFAWQARSALLLVAASGTYLLVREGGFARLHGAHAWWIELMLATWSVFVVILFVLEPLGVEHHQRLMRRPAAFLLLHVVLLCLALVTVAGAVVGSHGGL